MKTNGFLSIYLVAALLLMGLPLFGSQDVIDYASGNPDLVVNGDWIITSGPEVYSDEEITIYGDLIIESGGHLILNNCTLTMMYQYLQPYSIIVQSGGILELYDSYVTDVPDDDDSDFLSAWYYFIAREGSTLIIENSTIRQVGFLDPTNPEHTGLSVGTNQGHIKNSRINTSIVALAFVGNNTGFSVENINISDISMNAIMIINSQGGSVRNVSFQNIEERSVITAQNSWDFTLEDFNLSGDHQIRVHSSYGFTLGNITGYGNERLVEIEDSSDFILKNITIFDQYNWNRLLDIRKCFDFRIDQLSASNTNSVLSLDESYDGIITDINGSNITRIIDFNDVSSIVINGVSVDSSSDAIWIWNSENLTLENIYFSDTYKPIWLEGVNNSVLSNVTIDGFGESAVTLRGGSNNITISNANIETDSMDFTTGFRIEESFASLNSIYMTNINRSISVYDGDIHGEDIFINGTYLGDEGIELNRVEYVYLSNVSIQDQKWRGISIRNSLDSDIRMDNIYVNDINDAVILEDSNATLSNLAVTNAIWDLVVSGNLDRSFVTVMNSTLDWTSIWNSDAVFINTTNASSVNSGGVWSLTWKWWVDVYVSDFLGPVAGADITIFDNFFVKEVTTDTGLDGYARNLPVIDMIWNGGVSSKNPHITSASGSGWSVTNSTPYIVTSNMQVNVYYQWNAPPNVPANIVAGSDENSDVQLIWDPSTSWDVVGYNVYIAKDYSSLVTYVGLGVPNATGIVVPAYTHISGSDNWDKYFYAVKAVDNENESAQYVMAYCGDWVVNATSPQTVRGMNISVEGTLWVYGQLELDNTTLRIQSSSKYTHGIYIQNGSLLKWDNVTIERNSSYPYFFIIQPGTDVIINGSKIIRPGFDDQNSDVQMRGIHSLTENLTLTNTTVEVIYCGLGIYGVPNFTGQIYNNTFVVPSGYEAEYLMNISDSVGVNISSCSFEGDALYGIYGEYSKGIEIFRTAINIDAGWDETFYGIFLQECTDSRIFNNDLIFGSPSIYLVSSANTVIESSNISSRRQTGISAFSSKNTTIRGCSFDFQNGDAKTAIYLSWSTDSFIENMDSGDANPFLYLDNGTGAIVRNLTLINGENGIKLVNSNNIFVNDTYISFMFTGMTVIGSRDVTMVNLTINLTFYCIELKSPGPIYFIDSYIANGISNEIIAQGWGGEHGDIIFINSTIVSISDNSLKLNNSAVVSLINTSFNFTKLKIDDAGSRVEVYHYLSVQVYDIDMNIPAWANITIFNSLDFTVFNGQAPNGLAEWILIHERTVFRDDEYSDNPHNIVFDDGRHFGNVELYINETRHADVNVSNVPPWILWLEIHGQKGIQTSLNPTTDYDIVLNYSYQDSEGDPESGTIIRWYIDGTLDNSFNDLTTIPSQDTIKDQDWQAKVYPSDGYDSTYPLFPFETNVLRIWNTPPVVTNVTISPSDPTGGDDLFVDYDFYDLDDDVDSSRTTRRWSFWNEAIFDWDYIGIDSYYLSSQYTSKGQLWKCEVTPNDGDNSGNTVDSNTVQIGNTPPSASNPKITAESGELMITGADNLKATYNFTDPDGDSENGTSFQWYLRRGVDPWTSYAVNASILPFNYTRQGDLWRCRIIPMDGEDYGAMVWTDVVEIFNTPPTVSNVIITPSSPTSSDALSITYDFFDYDGDSDNGTSFRWVYEDALGAKDPGEYGDGVPASEIQKGQTWYCYVKPSDGKNVGTEVISPGVLVLNSPPSVISAVIEIVTTEGGRLLALNYTPSDVDADALSNVEIQWFADGNARPLFDNNQTVPGGNLVKGQLWYASLRVFDGESWSVWYNTESIAIPNTAPYLNGNPVLTPQKALSSQNLVPDFQTLYKDDDGDPLVSWDVRWYKDNGHMEEHDGLEEISWALTKKGEIWFCKIQVSDGEDTSEWYSSTTSVIENTPPSNVSVNPQQSEVVMIETDTMEFNVSAEDSDDDTLSYRWMLDGRIVLLEEGVGSSIYLLKTDYDSEGEYILRLVITDGDDIYENTWTIDIQKMNRLPEITVVGPEGRSATIDEDQSLAFSITKSDPDSDALDVRWLLDGVQVWEASDKYTYTPSFTASGSHDVTVEVYEKDTGANSTYTWSVEVENVESEAERREEFLGFSYDWWGLVLAILSGVVALLLATIGLMRVKKKKGRLKEYMLVTDKLMEEEEDPATIEEKLLEVEQQIKDEFSQGKIEDLHFLLLQDIIAGKRGEVRKATVARKFGRLPEGVLRDLDAMLKDGKISREEYGTFVSTISKSESLSPEEKEELSDMIGKWEEKDKDTISAELKEDVGLEEHLEDEANEEPGEKDTSSDTSLGDEGGEKESKGMDDESENEPNDVDEKNSKDKEDLD